MSGLERKYLLLKRGLYYAPDNAGYTGVKEQAGRYLQSDAMPDSGVTAIHEDEAFDFSPATHPETKVKYLSARITALEAENERMRGALERIAERDAYGLEIYTPHAMNQIARQALGGTHDAD